MVVEDGILEFDYLNDKKDCNIKICSIQVQYNI